MSFHLAGDLDSNYSKKLKAFLDFIFKINFSNNLYVDLSLSKPEDMTPKRKMYIGRGNNSLLVKSIAKRRFWWDITHNAYEHGIDFYWSQNKIDRVHAIQVRTNGRGGCGVMGKAKKSKLLEETYELNRKVMSAEQAVNVEKYILN